MRKNYKRRQLLLLVIDLLLFYTALLVALEIRAGGQLSLASYKEHVDGFLPILFVWIGVYYTAGLYSLERPFGGFEFAGKTIAVSAIAILLSALYFYLAPSVSISPKTNLALFSGFFTSAVLLWRYGYGKVSRVFMPKVGVAFIGATEEAVALAEEIELRAHLGYQARLFFDERVKHIEVLKVPLVCDATLLAQAIDDNDVDLVILTDERLLREDIQRRLFDLLERKIRFMRLPDFYELLLRRVPIGAINEAWFLENIDLRAKRLYDGVKRGIDFAGALAVFLVTLLLEEDWPGAP